MFYYSGSTEITAQVLVQCSGSLVREPAIAQCQGLGGSGECRTSKNRESALAIFRRNDSIGLARAVTFYVVLLNGA